MADKSTLLLQRAGRGLASRVALQEQRTFVPKPILRPTSEQGHAKRRSSAKPGFKFPIGEEVVVHGLVDRSDLNGKTGKVVGRRRSSDARGSVLGVEIAGTKIGLTASNLCTLSELQAVLLIQKAGKGLVDRISIFNLRSFQPKPLQPVLKKSQHQEAGTKRRSSAKPAFKFPIGEEVVVHGLVDRSDLNGKTGKVVGRRRSSDARGSVLGVEIAGTKIGLTASNLCTLSELQAVLLIQKAGKGLVDRISIFSLSTFQPKPLQPILKSQHQKPATKRRSSAKPAFKFPIGEEVVVHGLVDRSDLNGKTGKVVGRRRSSDARGSVLGVEIAGTKIGLTASNLCTLSELQAVLLIQKAGKGLVARISVFNLRSFQPKPLQPILKKSQHQESATRRRSSAKPGFKFPVGEEVIVYGLVDRSDLNGKVGKIVGRRRSSDARGSVLGVEIAGTKIGLTAQNVQSMREVKAAITVQRMYRGWATRLRYLEMQYADMEKDFAKRVVIVMQQAVRLWLWRKRRKRACGVIERAFRMFTALLRTAQRRSETAWCESYEIGEEAEQFKADENEKAVKIQAIARRWLARSHVQAIRTLNNRITKESEDSEHFAYQKNEKRAAQVVQSAVKRNAAMNQRDRLRGLRDKEESREAENYSACVIQRNCQIMLARKCLRRRFASTEKIELRFIREYQATLLQRRTRGMLARSKVAALKEARDERWEKERVREQREHAMYNLQRLGRGMYGRAETMRLLEAIPYWEGRHGREAEQDEAGKRVELLEIEEYSREVFADMWNSEIEDMTTSTFTEESAKRHDISKEAGVKTIELVETSLRRRIEAEWSHVVPMDALVMIWDAEQLRTRQEIISEEYLESLDNALVAGHLARVARNHTALKIQCCFRRWRARCLLKKRCLKRDMQELVEDHLWKIEKSGLQNKLRMREIILMEAEEGGSWVAGVYYGEAHKRSVIEMELKDFRSKMRMRIASERLSIIPVQLAYLCQLEPVERRLTSEVEETTRGDIEAVERSCFLKMYRQMMLDRLAEKDKQDALGDATEPLRTPPLMPSIAVPPELTNEMQHCRDTVVRVEQADRVVLTKIACDLLSGILSFRKLIKEGVKRCLEIDLEERRERLSWGVPYTDTQSITSVYSRETTPVKPPLQILEEGLREALQVEEGITRKVLIKLEMSSDVKKHTVRVQIVTMDERREGEMKMYVDNAMGSLVRREGSGRLDAERHERRERRDIVTQELRRRPRDFKRTILSDRQYVSRSTVLKNTAPQRQTQVSNYEIQPCVSPRLASETFKTTTLSCHSYISQHGAVSPASQDFILKNTYPPLLPKIVNPTADKQATPVAQPRFSATLPLPSAHRNDIDEEEEEEDNTIVSKPPLVTNDVWDQKKSITMVAPPKTEPNVTVRQLLRNTAPTATLDMEGLAWAEKDMMPYLLALPKNRNVTVLKLGGNRLGVEACGLLAELIRMPSCRLVSIRLNRCGLSHECGETLLHALKNNTSVVGIDITDNTDVDSLTAISLAQELAARRNAKVLQIQSKRLDHLGYTPVSAF